MAHGVESGSRLRLHQALHGYAEGHRELAVSTKLRPGDRKRLLTLSDVSGPSVQVGSEGYLTGYPLAESGFFALGRTWAAPEMSRPGCVWTHTLLVEFTDLGALETLGDLLLAFRRPRGLGAASEYRRPADLTAGERVCLSGAAGEWARRVIVALYGRPEKRIVAGALEGEVDRAVLEVWSQQWPRLRRNFRFCTLAGSDRSSGEEGFDLQVLPREGRSVRGRFVDVAEAEVVGGVGDRWVEDAVGDLLRPVDSGLRDLLRRLGAETEGGREAFRPICRLHGALKRWRAGRGAIGEAIGVVEGEFGAKVPLIARRVVGGAALAQVERLDGKALGAALLRRRSRDGRWVLRPAWQELLDPSKAG